MIQYIDSLHTSAKKGRGRLIKEGMIWGCNVGEGKPYGLNAKLQCEILHLSNATLVHAPVAGKLHVMLTAGKETFAIAVLQQGKVESAVLNLCVRPVQDVKFTVVGPGSINLLGYYEPIGEVDKGEEAFGDVSSSEPAECDSGPDIEQGFDQIVLVEQPPAAFKPALVLSTPDAVEPVSKKKRISAKDKKAHKQHQRGSKLGAELAAVDERSNTQPKGQPVTEIKPPRTTKRKKVV